MKIERGYPRGSASRFAHSQVASLACVLAGLVLSGAVTSAQTVRESGGEGAQARPSSEREPYILAPSVCVPGLDVFPSTAKIIFSSPFLGAPEVIRLSDNGAGTTQVQRQAKVGMTIDTELLALSLTGVSMNAGPVTVYRSPDPAKPSKGKIENVAVNGLCELTSGDSFFDVFVRIDIPNFGFTIYNEDAARVQTHIDQIPPKDAHYENPFVKPIPLYQLGFPPPANPPVAFLLYEIHDADPEFPPGDVDCFSTRMNATFFPFPAGPPMPLQASGPTQVKRSNPHPVAGTDTIDTQMTSMSLTGSGPPFGNYTITLNPTGPPPAPGGPSLGRITENLGPPTYPADSFFDVFFKIEPQPPNPATVLYGRNPAHMVADLAQGNPLPIVPPGFGQRYLQPGTAQVVNQAGAPIGVVSNIVHELDGYRSWIPIQPPPDKDCFDSWITLEIELFPPFHLPCSETVMLSGPFEVLRDLGAPGGPPISINTLFSCGIFKGVSSPLGCGLGPVMAHPSPTIPSAGGINSVAPDENFPTDSFFDVFVTLDTSAGPIHTQDPSHMAAVLNAPPPPPAGKVYYGPGTVILLYDSHNNVVGKIKEIKHEIHNTIICPCECEPRILFLDKTNLDVGIDPAFGGGGVLYDLVRGKKGTSTSGLDWINSMGNSNDIQCSGGPLAPDPINPGQATLLWYTSRLRYGRLKGTYNAWQGGAVNRDLLITPTLCP